MEVWHSLAAVPPVIDDHSEPGVGNAQSFGHLLRCQQKFAQKRLVFRGGLAHPWNHFFWHDKNVNGRLRRNIMECKPVVRLSDDF
jgi:hypothetical protein